MKFDFPTIKSLTAEFLCTFIFIFTICSNGLNEARTGVSTAAVSAGVSTGFAATAIIFAFGGLSGAHFNPAVTIGAIIGRKIDVVQGLFYIVLQLVAALLAVSTLIFLFPETGVADSLVLKVGENANVAQAVCFEFLMTFILVFVIYATAMGLKTTSTDSDVESQDEQMELIAENKEKLKFAPIAIGLTLGFLCFLGGTVSGGAFNPARATAPALLSGDLSDVWIYWVGDLLGAIVAALLYMKFFAR